MQNIPVYLMCYSVMRKRRQYWKNNYKTTDILIRPSPEFLNMPAQSSKVDAGKDLIK